MIAVLLRRLAVTLAMLAVLIWATASVVARADGHLDRDEGRWVSRYGTAICTVLDGFPSPTPWHVIGITEGVRDQGWPVDSAVDIVNASVDEYCPEYWPLLVMTGNMFRGAA